MSRLEPGSDVALLPNGKVRGEFEFRTEVVGHAGDSGCALFYKVVLNSTAHDFRKRVLDPVVRVLHRDLGVPIACAHGVIEDRLRFVQEVLRARARLLRCCRKPYREGDLLLRGARCDFVPAGSEPRVLPVSSFVRYADVYKCMADVDVAYRRCYGRPLRREPMPAQLPDSGKLRHLIGTHPDWLHAGFYMFPAHSFDSNGFPILRLKFGIRGINHDPKSWAYSAFRLRRNQVYGLVGSLEYMLRFDHPTLLHRAVLRLSARSGPSAATDVVRHLKEVPRMRLGPLRSKLTAIARGLPSKYERIWREAAQEIERAKTGATSARFRSTDPDIDVLAKRCEQ